MRPRKRLCDKAKQESAGGEVTAQDLPLASEVRCWAGWMIFDGWNPIMSLDNVRIKLTLEHWTGVYWGGGEGHHTVTDNGCCPETATAHSSFSSWCDFPVSVRRHTGPSIPQCTAFFLDQTRQTQLQIKAEHSTVCQAGCVALRTELSLWVSEYWMLSSSFVISSCYIVI